MLNNMTIHIPNAKYNPFELSIYPIRRYNPSWQLTLHCPYRHTETVGNIVCKYSIIHTEMGGFDLRRFEIKEFIQKVFPDMRQNRM